MCGSAVLSRRLVQMPYRMRLRGVGETRAPEVSARARRTPLAELPNGLKVAYTSRSDLQFLYNEVFVEQTYLKEGVRLFPGAVVIDVGANIGLFTLFAAEAVGEKGVVISAEPIPAIFEALETNIASFFKLHGGRVGSIKPLNVGLSDGSSAEAQFTYYPRAAGWSSMRPDQSEVRNAMDVFLDRSLRSGSTNLPASRLAGLGRLLHRLLPHTTFAALSRAFVGYLLGKEQATVCKLLTLSEVLTWAELQHVDLLKVDVERAELAVLEGISEAHWPSIKQAVLEVHDLDGRLAAVESLLKAKGFRVVSQQTDALRGTRLHTVYSTRG